MYHSTTYPSPVGLITLACDGDNLVGLWNEGQKYHGGAISKAMTEKNDMPVFDTVRHWLDGYFAGEKPDIANLPLAPIGGEFRKEVWDILCGIPYGETVTYGYIANKIAAKRNKDMSSQAVGGAVGHNPIAIIIPCHRVVGANGNLTGYAGGFAIKKKLMELEGIDMSSMFVPR